MNVLIDQSLERMYALNVGVVGHGPERHERPHKPLLLLAVLEMLDSFGQRSVLTFSSFQSNVAIEAASFQFKPPAGADVIRQ